jgi:hypothetical protein
MQQAVVTAAVVKDRHIQAASIGRMPDQVTRVDRRAEHMIAAQAGADMRIVGRGAYVVAGLGNSE